MQFMDPARQYRSRMFCGCATVAIAFALTSKCYADGKEDASLALLIQNVLDNEQMYDDVEVGLDATYEALVEFNPDRPVVTLQKETTWFVCQAGKFRLETKALIEAGSDSSESRRVRVFDGEFTKLVEDDTIANIREGRVLDSRTIRPHMLLVWGGHGVNVDLSTYLRGDEAIAAVAPGELQPDVWIVASYRGSAAFQGLRCQKVWITTYQEGAETWAVRREFWLAEDRNYIPVRMLSFTSWVSETTPQSEGSVLEFTELEPGIWYPTRASVTSYQGLELQEKGRQVPQWKRTYSTTSASLQPGYPDEYFSELEIPYGAATYHLDERGKLLRSHYHGAPEAPEGSAASAGGFQRWWLLWANAAILTGLATVWLVRRFLLAKAPSTGEK